MEYSVNLSKQSQTIFESQNSIQHLKVMSGNPRGVTFDGEKVCIFPEIYSSLADGETETLIISFSVTNPFGVEFPKIVTLTIKGTSDQPQVFCDQYTQKQLSEDRVCFEIL